VDSVAALTVSAARVLAEVWRRATSVQPIPPLPVIGAIAVLGAFLVLARPCWPVTRLVITVAHEGGHAVAAVLTGRRLHGIRVHRDTSGVTLSRGRPRGVGMVVTLLGGYLGPAAAGVAAAAVLAAGYSLGLLWLAVLVGLWLLLQIRNAYGVLVVAGGGAALAATSWWLPSVVASSLAYLFTWVLLLAAPKPVLELARSRRGGASGSDVDQLAALTWVPAVLWIALLFILSCAGLVAGAWLLAPTLVHQFAAAFG